MEFQWIPGTEPDQKAIERMSKHFPKPTTPMTDTTLGNIRFYTAAFEEPIETLELKQLLKFLEDIASLISAEGLFDEWVKWFHYVLAYTLNRSYETRLEPVLTNLITAFFDVYREELTEEYDGFRQDIINTLAVAIMQPAFWYKDSDFQIQEWEITVSAYNYEASKTLSASMFLCLKILTPDEIRSWVASLLTISGPKWKSQLVRWLVNADNFFEAEFEPGKPIEGYLSECGLGWWSDVFLFRLKASLDEFVPKANFELFRSKSQL